MNRYAYVSSILLLCASAAWSQTSSAPAMSPPKMLVIQREFIKPGKNGSAHEKTESGFVKAMAAAKWPTHYVAMNSISGPDRALFFTAYNCYDDWEKDHEAGDKNVAMSSALDRAWAADGDLLTSSEQTFWDYRDDLSLRPDGDISHVRYFEIMQLTVKPGHDREFEELVKMFKSVYGDQVAAQSWAVYQNHFGAQGDVYLAIFAHKAMTEVDKGFDQDKAAMNALGQTGQKKVEELTAASVEMSQTNLFHFDPKMSYPDPHWVESDPDFWKPKPAPAPKPAAPATP
jgi:hypothetical protein